MHQLTNQLGYTARNKQCKKAAPTQIPSGAGTFLDRGGAENINYKFRFAKKWPIICIN